MNGDKSGESDLIRILTVDDHPLLREGIAGLVADQSDMSLVAEASNGREAIQQFRTHRPDVTLMDLQMPDMNGLDAMVSIRSEFPEARIIILTTYTGDVVVRSSTSARPVVWSTEPADYVAAAWAGNTLLAYRIGEDERLDVLAFDGPGEQRTLMADADLVAVSPDGTQAFLASQENVPGSVSVVNVADGTIAATLELGSLQQGILWAAYGGSWLGDLVAAPTNAGIAVFDVGTGAISLRELLKNDPNTLANDIIEPQFSGDTDHIIARGDARPGTDTAGDEDTTTTLECDLATATCLARAADPGGAWLHPAYNPSRPKGDDS